MSDFVYYVSPESQSADLGEGLMVGYAHDGTPIHPQSRLADGYALETRDPTSIVAKAIDARCSIKCSRSTVSVSFRKGSREGEAFMKSLGATIPERSRCSVRSVRGQTTYFFDRNFALGSD